MRTVVAAGAVAAVLAAAGSAAVQRAAVIAVSTDAGVVLVRADGRGRVAVPLPNAGGEAALSPDGARIAYVDRDGDLAVYGIADRKVSRRPTPGWIESRPAWSPDGASIAYSAHPREGEGSADIFVAGASLRAARKVVGDPSADTEPAWSPLGTRIVFASDRAGTVDLWVVDAAGGVPDRLSVGPGAEHQPAWSPDAKKIVFKQDADVAVLELGVLAAPLLLGQGAYPAWSPDGTRVAFTTGAAGDGPVAIAPATGGTATPLAGSRPGDRWPSWRAATLPPPPEPPKPKVDPNELLPDLDQRAPSNLVVTSSGGRFLLGFTSATDNIGRGPIRLRGFRVSRAVGTMRADQVVDLKNGKQRVLKDVGLMRYTYSPTHTHWHILKFQSYELRRASDFAVLVRDRKTGFCLGDHYGLARHRVAPGTFTGARFFGNCGTGRPDLLSVEQGTSVGYTDRYPAFFHGQNVDVTGLAPGRYVLVHRANQRERMRETKYTNNAASVLLQLSWPNGRRSTPSVRVLRICEATERCGPAGDVAPDAVPFRRVALVDGQLARSPRSALVCRLSRVA
jgi:hypothetical protein